MGKGGEKGEGGDEGRRKRGSRGRGRGRRTYSPRFLHFTKRLSRSENEIKSFSAIQKLKTVYYQWTVLERITKG